MFDFIGFLVCFVGVVAFSADYFWFSKRLEAVVSAPEANPLVVAKLAQLGWGIRPSANYDQFEISGGKIPSPKESAEYFEQIAKPFGIVLAQPTDLAGLHYLKNALMCTTIQVNAGDFTDISELNGFIHLRKLYISQVPLNVPGTVDADALVSNVNLEELSLSGSRVRDIGFVANLQKLKILSLGQTLVSDITAISKLHTLENVDLRGSQVTDLTPLMSNKGLRELGVGGVQVPSIMMLKDLSIKSLSVVEQQNYSIAPIASLTKLETLFLWGPTDYLDVSPLVSLTNLRTLQIGGIGFFTRMRIANYDAIGKMTSLNMLVLGYAEISNIGFVGNLTKLTDITLNDMAISSIEPLRALKALKKVSLNMLPVADVSPLLDLPKLTELTIGRTPARSDVIAELERRGVKVTRY